MYKSPLCYKVSQEITCKLVRKKKKRGCVGPISAVTEKAEAPNLQVPLPRCQPHRAPRQHQTTQGNSGPEPWERKARTGSSQRKPHHPPGMGKSRATPRTVGSDPRQSAGPPTFSSGGMGHLTGNLIVRQQDGFC